MHKKGIHVRKIYFALNLAILSAKVDEFSKKIAY